jgi:uncharacterized membrane protein YgaE (UPF0421/DUF939 family)
MSHPLIDLARRRVRVHSWPILQTGVAAVAAWSIAQALGIQHRPAFASIAAVISLGATFGQRRQRAIQLIGGVMLGIVLADLLVRAIGSGLPQIGILVVGAMMLAVVCGGSELLVTEAAVSAILVATVSATPEVRLSEVLIGGGVALAVNTLVFPPDPVVGVARATEAVFGELGVVLRDCAAALSTGDVRHAEAATAAAEQVERHVASLHQEVMVGDDTARWAPLRRPMRGELRNYARTVGHAEQAARTARVLARNIHGFVRSGRRARSELADAIRDLGLASWELPGQFQEPWRSEDVIRIALHAAGRATASAMGDSDITLNEIVGGIRTIAIDIVRASEAGETDSGELIDAPTEQLLAALPLPAATPVPVAAPPANTAGVVPAPTAA